MLLHIISHFFPSLHNPSGLVACVFVCVGADDGLAWRQEYTVLCYHISICVCVVLLVQQVTHSVIMLKRGSYNQEYHHKQSRYVVKEYSRYRIDSNAKTKTSS